MRGKIMSENVQTESNEHMPCCSASKEGAHCPMSAKFDSTVGNPKFRVTLFGVGVVFIFLGIVILMWPVVVVWITAMVAVLIGVIVITAASFLTKMKSSA